MFLRRGAVHLTIRLPRSPPFYRNKKRYAGLMWTRMEEHDKMDTKGLETVRRDNCALVRDVIQTSLDKILIQQDVQGAINYVKSQISDLLQVSDALFVWLATRARTNLIQSVLLR